MIDTSNLLDDVAFAKGLLEKETLSNSDIVFSLRNLLKMKYYPVAVKYFFSDEDMADFKKTVAYKKALHPFTFCQYVAASRQRGTSCWEPMRKPDVRMRNMLWAGKTSMNPRSKAT